VNCKARLVHPNLCLISGPNGTLCLSCAMPQANPLLRCRIAQSPATYRFARTAAPPNSAPTASAAVLTGGAAAFVLELPPADVVVGDAPAADALAEAADATELTRAETELARLLSSEASDDWAGPVAVARTLLIELSSEAALLVSE